MNLKRIYFNKLVVGNLYHITQRCGNNSRIPYKPYVQYAIYLQKKETSWFMAKRYYIFYDIINRKEFFLSNNNSYYRHHVYEILP